MPIKRAELDAVAPLFGAYRQLYGQRSDVAAAQARRGALADVCLPIALTSPAAGGRDDEFQHYQLLA